MYCFAADTDHLEACKLVHLLDRLFTEPKALAPFHALSAPLSGTASGRLDSCFQLVSDLETASSQELFFFMAPRAQVIITGRQIGPKSRSIYSLTGRTRRVGKMAEPDQGSG